MALARRTKEKPLSDWRTNLAPRPRPWREIVDAADWLRHDRGVSKSLWDEACIAISPRGGGHRLGHAGGAIHGQGVVHGWEVLFQGLS